MLAVTRVGESYLFVRHWRHATGRFHLEFPRGFTDQNEEPDHAVIRELREEISADVSSASLLGTIYTDTGLLNFPINVYSVQIVNYALGDGDEGIDRIELLSDSQVFEHLRRNEINDSLTLAAFLLARG